MHNNRKNIIVGTTISLFTICAGLLMGYFLYFAKGEPPGWFQAIFSLFYFFAEKNDYHLGRERTWEAFQRDEEDATVSALACIVVGVALLCIVLFDIQMRKRKKRDETDVV